MNLLDFPEDIFERLFSYFTVKEALRFEAVSRRCQQLAIVHYWRHVTNLNLLTFLRLRSRIDVANAYKFDAAAAGLIKRVGPALKSLILSKFGPLEYGLRFGLEGAVVEFCFNLQTLELNNRLLERNWLLQVSAAIPRLKHLSLNHLYIRNYGELDDKYLSLVLKKLRRLENLSVRDNKKISGSCHADLPIRLNNLDLQGCSVSAFNLCNLLKRCRKLVSLSIMYPPDLALIDASLLANLRQLSVDSCHGLLGNNDNFSRCMTLLTNIRVLTVYSHLTTDLFFKMVSRHLKNLRELAIPGSRHDRVEAPAAALTHLTALPYLRKMILRGNSLAWLFLTLCNRFKRLVEIDASFSLKQRSPRDLDWGQVSSDSLEILVVKGINAPGQKPGAMAAGVYLLLKPTCPSLKTVVI